MREIVLGMSLLTQGAEQFTGTATYVRELLREFGRRPGQVRVEALCNEHAMVTFAECAADSVALKLAHTPRISRSRAGRAVALSRMRLSPGRFAGQLSSDVQVIHYPLTLGVPRFRLPTVLSLHDVQHHDLPEHFSRGERLWRRVFYDAPAGRAGLVHTLSEYSKLRIAERLDIDPDNIVVIPLAVDHRRFRPAHEVDDDELLAPLDLPARFLFYPATLWPHKNHLTLLEALSQADDAEVHLVLCGATFGRLDQLLAAAARVGIGDRVRHVGFVSEAVLPAMYRRAAALIFPTTYEGFGAPVLEAMASGCPVASTLVGPLPEVRGDAALDLVHDDPRQIAGAIDRIVGDQALRTTLRAAGLNQSRRFSWSATADAHLAAYVRASALPH